MARGAFPRSRPCRRVTFTLPLPVLYSGSCSQRQRAVVRFVKFHHGVPWPGPESAEGYGAAHRILRRMSGLGATVVQNLIFRYLQNGFDEYMNLVLDDAEEIHSKTKSRKQLGRIMLKGDNITLLQSVSN
ncbi:small nuclear ribonucleoprotein E isoform X3 [Pan paniscus]|uniref:small nuclear ribonucleoprotein E isoform X3 n=1 Tax=Pan paniscus TaxID=9597 RepID=UPI0024373EBA|nr:small nuclear ribonucleoprotein E isoform X2 [Pan paniscus]